MEFVPVEDPEILLPILESRLPKATHSYNMVKMSPKFPEMKIYVLNGEISDDSCVVIVHYREDYFHEVNVSVPEGFQVTDEIKNIFTNSPIFDWDKSYIVSSVERSLTSMFVEISAFIKGNAVELLPCNLYYLECEEAVKLEIRDIPNTIVKPLEKISGGEFLSRSWKYRLNGTEKYTHRAIERNETLGIYVDENLVCGSLLNVHGQIGMLHTDPEYRQRGFAKLVFQSMMKKCAANGIIPCSTAELRNPVTTSFNEKIGMKFSHVVDFVFYTASGF